MNYITTKLEVLDGFLCEVKEEWVDKEVIRYYFFKHRIREYTCDIKVIRPASIRKKIQLEC